jgi:hypothetical protein
MSLGIGLGIQSSKVTTDLAAAAYFTRAGVTNATAKSRINSFIVGMKSLGLYSLLTGCWIGRSAYNAGTGTTVFDLVSNTLNGTMVNSPAWGAAGIVFSGTTQAVTTGRTQTMNGSWSAFQVVTRPTASIANQRLFGTAAPAGASLLFTAGATMSAVPIGLFDGTVFPFAGTLDITSMKMVGVTYSVANKQNFYSGAASVGTGADALAASSHTVQLSSSSDGMSAGTISVAMIFGATELTGAQVTSLYNLLKTTICVDQSLP